MGLMTGLATFTTMLQIIFVVSAVLIGLALVAGAVDFFRNNRPRRLALHESIPTYYFQGHAFAH